MPPRRKVSVEETADEVQVKPTRSKSATAKATPAKEVKEVKRFNPADMLMEEIDIIEKKTGYTNDGIGRHSPRLSTGVLAIDMYMDGGLVAGGWYTVAGGEQSCKSTLTMTLLASVVKQQFKGIGAIFDFEGSTDEKYILSIFKNFKIEIDISDIFGIQDPVSGKWIKRGRFRYYPPSNGERFFDFMAQLRKILPDKVVQEGGEGYLIYENTVPNRKAVGDSYDKEYFRRNNKFKVLAEDAGAQAIVVVDSYPAMLPDSMDGEDKAGALAIQARMFSDGIKRFRGSMRKKMISIFGVNQLRKNPMNTYEPDYEPCFIGSTPVHLADGTIVPIKDVVENRLDVYVRSFNRTTLEVENKRIVDWKSNGFKEADDLVVIRYATGFGDHGHFTSTKNHKIWCSGTWVEACDLIVGSNIYTERHACLSSMYVTAVEPALVGEYVYDLTVEDNHTYFVGDSAEGVAVSNCGDALKFYCFDPDTEIVVDGNVFTASSIYQEGVETQVNVLTRSKHKLATLFKTDGGKYPTALKVDYHGVVLACSEGHALLNVSKSIVPSVTDESLQIDVGRIAWTRAKDIKVGDYGFVLNIEHYTSKLSYVVPVHARSGGMQAKAQRVDTLNRYWYAFIVRMFPVLDSVLFYLLEHDLLIPDEHGFIYDSGMIQNVVDTFYFSNANPLVLSDTNYEDVSMSLAYMDDIFALLDESRDFIPVPLSAVHEHQCSYFLDVNEPETGTVVTSGLLSHNSDVRFRLQSRAIPPGFKGERKVVEEESVEVEGRVDRYRFISGRSIKNKLGGIPNQEFWLRLWEADGKGKGRGFDPVYDVYFFLKTIGLITGQLNKIKFMEPCPLAKARRAISWQELRILILGNKTQIKEMCDKVEVKGFALRKWCFDFVITDKCKSMVVDSVVAKGSSIKDNEEVD